MVNKKYNGNWIQTKLNNFDIYSISYQNLNDKNLTKTSKDIARTILLDCFFFLKVKIDLKLILVCYILYIFVDENQRPGKV